MRSVKAYSCPKPLVVSASPREAGAAALSVANVLERAMVPRMQTDLFASTEEQEILLEDPLARRSIYLESLLCIAIRKRVLVKLQLKEYIAERLFEPTVVYLSKNHRPCVAGVQ